MKNLHPVIWGMVGAAAFSLLVKNVGFLQGIFGYDPASGAYTVDPNMTREELAEMMAQASQ